MKKFLIITSYLLTICISSYTSIEIWKTLAEKQIIEDQRTLDIKRQQIQLELDEKEILINAEQRRTHLEQNKAEWEQEIKKRKDQQAINQ